MTKEQYILSQKNIAVVGVNSNKNKMGYKIFDAMKLNGGSIYSVNSNFTYEPEKKRYNNLDQIKEKIDSVIIILNPNNVKTVIEQVIKSGIKNVWINLGSASNEVDEYCTINNLNFVSGKCVFMYLEPVKGFHKFHRFFARLSGKY